jgi:hypothetical protein
MATPTHTLTSTMKPNRLDWKMEAIEHDGHKSDAVRTPSSSPVAVVVERLQ